MIPNKYQLIKVDVPFPPSLADQGFQVWKWLIPLDAFEAPLEPLTQEFWNAYYDSVMVYGISFFATFVHEGGNLLVLLTQQLRKNHQAAFGSLSPRQRKDLLRVIVKFNDIQIRGIQIAPEPFRQEVIEKCESFFEEYIMPRLDEYGNYYRKVPEEETKFLKPDEHGRFRCTRCRRTIAFGSGAQAMDTVYVEDGTRIAVSICKHCGEVLLVDLPGS
jgi:hypothetical protein